MITAGIGTAAPRPVLRAFAAAIQACCGCSRP